MWREIIVISLSFLYQRTCGHYNQEEIVVKLTNIPHPKDCQKFLDNVEVKCIVLDNNIVIILPFRF